MKIFATISLFLLILSVWSAPIIADYGAETPAMSLVFVDVDPVPIRHTDKENTSKSNDYGGDQNADNPDGNCSDFFEITELIKPDKPQLRLLSANDLDVDNRQHIPLE